jgi:hypothetical protein
MSSAATASMAAWMAATASSLLSSTPMMLRTAPVARMARRTPVISAGASSSITRWSQVR